jgi:hypothetical protein
MGAWRRAGVTCATALARPAPGAAKEGAIVFGVALFVRLVYLLTAAGPAFDHPIIDADSNDAMGMRVASGQGFGPGPFWQPPLYPLVLAALYSMFGHTLLAPRLLQALLGASTAVLTWAVGRQLATGTRLGLVAGVLVACHGSLVFYDGELLATTLGVWLAMLGLWLGFPDPQAPRSGLRALAAGAVLGWAALAVAVLGLLLVPVAWASLAPRRSRALLVLLGGVLAIAPVTILNTTATGEFVPISTNGGLNLWIGNNERADETIAIRPGRQWAALIDEPRRRGARSAAACDAYYRDRAIGFCLNQPLDCLRNIAGKVRLLLVARELPRNEDIYVVRDQSPVLEVLLARVGSLALPYGLLWPLALAGAVVCARARRRELTFLLLAGAALAAGPVLFFVTGRYRAPLAPVLCLLGALGARALWKTRRDRVVPVIAGVGLVLTLLPADAPTDQVSFEADLHFNVGWRQEREGKTADAVVSYRRALSVEPTHFEAGNNLAHVLEDLGRPGEAAAAWEALATHHPTFTNARVRAQRLREATAREASSP